MPLVTILIPTYNCLAKLARALESVAKVDYPVADFDVIVVDDGSTDGTGDMVRALAAESRLRLRYLYQENRGPAAARNAGIREAAGKYVLIIDSDCYVDQGILRRYLVHYPDERLGGVGGNVLPDSGNTTAKYLDYISTWRPYSVAGIVHSLVTANAFFLKEAIVRSGFFDEDFRRPGFEETELCHRMRKMGYYFKYDKDAVAVHAHRTALPMMIRMFVAYGRGYAIFVSKWPGDLARRPWLGRELTGGNAWRKFRQDYVRNLNLWMALVFLFLEYVKNVSFAYGFHTKMGEFQGGGSAG